MSVSLTLTSAEGSVTYTYRQPVPADAALCRGRATDAADPQEFRPEDFLVQVTLNASGRERSLVTRGVLYGLPLTGGDHPPGQVLHCAYVLDRGGYLRDPGPGVLAPQPWVVKAMALVRQDVIADLGVLLGLRTVR